MAPLAEGRSLVLKTRDKIALASIASRFICGSRRLMGLAAVVETTRAGHRWQLDLREGIDLAIYLLGHFEKRSFQQYSRYVKDGSIALDIGANVGAHTLPLAGLVGPRGQVVAFEPTRYAHSKLCANLSLNPVLQARVRPEQLMLGASDTATIPTAVPSSWPLSKEPSRHALHGGVARSTEGARVCTLDSYLARHGIGRVDFVKLDVDGHECSVLDGATHMLTQLKPVILFEIAPYALEENGASLTGFLDRFRQHGYALVREDGKDRKSVV